jgi:COP9 signalosome complex subunit 2
MIVSISFTGMVETDPEAALAGFAEVVSMEPQKAEW